VPTIPGHPLPPDKQQDQQAIASRIASARAHAGVKPSAPPPQANAVVTPSESWALGIVQTGQDSMFAGLAETGVWGGIVNGTEVDLFAGSAATDGSGSPNTIGSIVVLVVTPSNPDGAHTHYSDPTLPGPYRITSASGTAVHLVAGNGQNFTFNAGNDTFGG
jgi:hypothetical protein